MRDIDTDTWRVATWATPVAFQVVVAGLAAVMWPLGQLPPLGPGADSQTVGLCGLAITTPLWMLAGAVLLSGRSPRWRGIGLAIAGSGVVMMLFGLTYLLVVLPLLRVS